MSASVPESPSGFRKAEPAVGDTKHGHSRGSTQTHPIPTLPQRAAGWVGTEQHILSHPIPSLVTSRLVVDALALAAGGVGQQGGLLVVGVHGAGGDDVVLVFVHQGQLCIITPWAGRIEGNIFQGERPKEKKNKREVRKRFPWINPQHPYKMTGVDGPACSQCSSSKP